MAIQIEVYKDATVTYKNGSKKQYDAIYPTFNGLVIGELVKEKDVYEYSKRRRFGKAKPVEKRYITYYCFNDLGFIRDGEYTFLMEILSRHIGVNLPFKKNGIVSISNWIWYFFIVRYIGIHQRLHQCQWVFHPHGFLRFQPWISYSSSCVFFDKCRTISLPPFWFTCQTWKKINKLIL